jgi:hypothetical protein
MALGDVAMAKVKGKPITTQKPICGINQRHIKA